MKRHVQRRSVPALTLLVLLVALSLTLWFGCGEQAGTPTGPEAQQELVLSVTDPQVQAVMEIQDRHTDELLARPGIIGTATGMTEEGRPAVIVFAKSATLAKGAALPPRLEKAPVIVEVVGEIKALKGRPPRDDVDPTGRFPRPVPIGVSTGHFNITAGTIGCRVKDASGNVYALSNNHVYADENRASIGDNVLQPGPFDGGVNPDDAIGTLFAFAPIVFSTSANNVIDAAIALSSTANLGNATPSNGYGTPKSQTLAASIGMRVMKYGRTTVQTKGRVDAINATLDVGYDSGVARFVDQIVIRPGSFSAGGDSGSLIVAQKGKDARKPVGLLFAGSSLVTIANPIDAVLGHFNVTVDGE